MATAIETSDEHGYRTRFLEFEGFPIGIVTSPGGRIWVSVSDTCRIMGLKKATQLRKLSGSFWAGCTQQRKCVDVRGKRRLQVLISISKLPAWLAGINELKANAQVADRVINCRKYLAGSIRSQIKDAEILTPEVEVIPVASTELAVVPAITLETIPFHGGDLQAIRTPEGVFVSIRRVCENLGIDYKTQHRKLSAAAWAGMVTMPIPDDRGRPQEQSLVELSCLPKWLGDIDVDRVKPEAREVLIQHQQECYVVLARHFGLMPVAPAAEVVVAPPAAVPHEVDVHLNIFERLEQFAEKRGLTSNQAALCADRGFERYVGFSLLKALQLRLPSPKNEKRFTPTNLGSRICVSGQKMNLMLEIAGLQTGIRLANGDRDWLLTERGKEYGQYEDRNRQHTDGTCQQIMWLESVLDVVNAKPKVIEGPSLFA